MQYTPYRKPTEDEMWDYKQQEIEARLEKQYGPNWEEILYENRSNQVSGHDE